MQIRYGERNKKRDQSLAEIYKARLRAPLNKAAAEAKMQARAISAQQQGDDNIYTMPDLSRLLHRVLVDEYHVFDNRVTEITEDMARVAMLKYPQLAVDMILNHYDIVIYNEIIERKKVTCKELSLHTGFSDEKTRLSLRELNKKGYIYSKEGNANSGRAILIHYPVL